MTGAMAAIRLKHLIGDTDRHGNRRWYVRVPGARKQRLHGEPGSADFMAAYHIAIAAAQSAPRTGGTVRHGSLRWLVNQWYGSAEFQAAAPATQKQRRSILERVCSGPAGDLAARSLPASSVLAGLKARESTPGAAGNYLKVLGTLYRWGIDRGHVETDPTAGIKRPALSTDGWHTWTAQERDRFRDAHPIGTTPRLVFALAFCAGLRKGDIASLLRSSIQPDGFIKFRQGKTRKHSRTIEIFILPELANAIAAIPAHQSLFLVENSYGNRFTPNGLGNAMKRWTQAAGLPAHCALHGLRKGVATDLAEHGVSENGIAAVLGHTGTKSAAVYTRAANQKRLARAALSTLGEQSVPPVGHFTKSVGQKGD